MLSIADLGKPVARELFFVSRLLRLCGVPGCSSQIILRKLSLETIYIRKTELRQTVKRGKKLNNHAVVDKLY